MRTRRFGCACISCLSVVRCSALSGLIKRVGVFMTLLFYRKTFAQVLIIDESQYIGDKREHGPRVLKKLTQRYLIAVVVFYIEPLGKRLSRKLYQVVPDRKDDIVQIHRQPSGQQELLNVSGNVKGLT